MILLGETYFEVDGIDPWQWLGFLRAGGKGGHNGRLGLSIVGTQAPDQGFKTSSCHLDIPVEGGDQTLYSVAFHFEVVEGTAMSSAKVGLPKIH